MTGAVAVLFLGFLTGQVRAVEPCCAITAIDAGKGIVTARVKATGQIFQFAVKTPAVLRSLKIGQGIYANLSAKQVSLDGRTACCGILGAPVTVTGTGQIPVTLTVSPQSATVGQQDPPVIITAYSPGVPPKATLYRFAAVVPLNGDTYNLGGGTDPGVQWVPREGGDYQLTATVQVVVPPDQTGTVPTQISSGTASVSYHVSPKIVSTPTLSAHPFLQKTSDSQQIPYSLPGNISLSATVSLPTALPEWGRTRLNVIKFIFDYEPGFGNPATAPPREKGGGTIETQLLPQASWTPSPQPGPDYYKFGVHVQTFLNGHLIAEGAGGLDGYVVLIPPGPCASWTTPANPTLPFGWLSPITTQNTTQPVGAAQKFADCAIASSTAGYTLNDIVNNPQVRVRRINIACVNCHVDWGWQQKSAFCQWVPRFGHTTDEPVLNNLLQYWKSQGCPN